MVQPVHCLLYHHDQNSVQQFGIRKEAADHRPRRYHVQDWTSPHSTSALVRAFLVFL